ncbi:hypothetical protein ACFOU2_11205 [Bacillus songklensis]|uniref:YtxH domain-containing protein n=1 Tax=Bacillus songklensis TaxID=1069116 RepID=A0ABV8B407_9BACI
MFKKLFSLNNPMGLVIASATIVLALSPGARKGTRRLLVKGAGAVLALGDQVKDLTTGVRKQLGTIVEEAKAEKEMMMVSDVSETMKKGVEEGIEKTKQAAEKTKQTFSHLFKEENTNKPVEQF